MDQTDWTLSH